MIDTLEALIAAHDRGEPLAYRLFWKATPWPSSAATDSCLSQWWRSDFVIEGTTYTSAEQWMMASKARLFGDERVRAKILAASDPAEIKRLGREVQKFDEARWRERRLELVTEGNVAKFDQQPALRAHLLSTGDDILVEASPLDRIWGTGLAEDHPDARVPTRWPGLNLLGFALIRARAQLRGGSR